MSFSEKFSKKGLYRRYYPTKFGEIFRTTFFSDKTSSANIYLLKANSTSSRKRCGICSKLMIKAAFGTILFTQKLVVSYLFTFLFYRFSLSVSFFLLHFYVEKESNTQYCLHIKVLSNIYINADLCQEMLPLMKRTPSNYSSNSLSAAFYLFNKKIYLVRNLCKY